MKSVRFCYSILITVMCTIGPLPAQQQESPIKVFGYFQNIFSLQNEEQRDRTTSSFTMQQLNLFLQKDLAKNWTAFVDFEFTNSYSSYKQWGAFKLAEAWVRYRASRQLNLRLGLQIPTFNHLNEIKNRTPLLPYITRPLVYETSFQEFIAVDEFVPDRSFAQVFGNIPANKIKLDYALFLGNSPNINDSPARGQTGSDTSSVMLIGGRVGVRSKSFKAGVSATWDKVNFSTTADEAAFFNLSISDFLRIPRQRFGGDISYYYKNFTLESEYIKVNYDHDLPNIQANKEFFYSTLGYQINERLYVYGSYWESREYGSVISSVENSQKIYYPKVTVSVPNGGAAYNFSDRIFIKLHIAHGKIKSSEPVLFQTNKFMYYQTAVSVVF